MVIEKVYIELESYDAAAHFALEEYCMSKLQMQVPVLLLWRTDPCVMLGAYQIAEAEVDLILAEQRQVQIVRRSTGGGSIYTDRGTILYTVITPYTETEDVKRIQREIVAGPIIKALNAMRAPVKFQGRNDILLNNRKISGLAQRIWNNYLCSHGSLLYDADLDLLGSLLTPDQGKIKSHALRSTRSRVTNIIDSLDSKLSTADFLAGLKEQLFKDVNITEYVLRGEDLQEIEAIRVNKYANPSWTFAKNPPFSFHNELRFPLGKLEVYLNVVKGQIVNCKFYGDFLGLRPLQQLEEQIEKQPYDYNVIREILANVDLTDYLGGLSSEQLLSCLFNRKGGNR